MSQLVPLALSPHFFLENYEKKVASFVARAASSAIWMSFFYQECAPLSNQRLTQFENIGIQDLIIKSQGGKKVKKNSDSWRKLLSSLEVVCLPACRVVGRRAVVGYCTRYERTSSGPKPEYWTTASSRYHPRGPNH